MDDRLWHYRAKITRVIDGDTVEAEIDVGFRIVMTQRLRLLGINAPEKQRPTRTEGDIATDALKELLQAATDNRGYVLIRTEQDDAFGRYLAIIYLGGNTLATVNAAMIDGGWAVEDKR